ncbi:MAG: tRNA epoxyqueuosine(34) reductase QueG [Bryobacteraceae bacterium]
MTSRDLTSPDLTSGAVRQLALECGFDLAGVARAATTEDRELYREWVEAGYAGEMRYLTDHRAALRDDPRQLLAPARSVISVGKLYNTPWPYSTQFDEPGRAWISRYAWGGDYHGEMRGGLERLERALRERAGGAMEARICVDTAPLLERTYARLAGLGWIGKNTCLINQQRGSWFFLGELLVSLAIEPGPEDTEPPDRCGSCTRCIDACPTAALVPSDDGYTLDSRLCISYFTIELRGAVPKAHRAGMGAHVFGCDICQDVCPWNRRAPATSEAAYAPRWFAPPLDRMAELSEADFRKLFGGTPVTRARHSGFLRNVAIAMGNQRRPEYRPALERLAASQDPLVAEHAQWALEQLP